MHERIQIINLNKYTLFQRLKQTIRNKGKKLHFHHVIINNHNIIINSCVGHVHKTLYV